MARIYQKKSKLKQDHQREDFEHEHVVPEHQGLSHPAVPVAYSNNQTVAPSTQSSTVQKKESEKKQGQVDSPYQYHVPRQFAAVPPVQGNWISSILNKAKGASKPTSPDYTIDQVAKDRDILKAVQVYKDQYRNLVQDMELEVPRILKEYPYSEVEEIFNEAKLLLEISALRFQAGKIEEANLYRKRAFKAYNSAEAKGWALFQNESVWSYVGKRVGLAVIGFFQGAANGLLGIVDTAAGLFGANTGLVEWNDEQYKKIKTGYGGVAGIAHEHSNADEIGKLGGTIASTLAIGAKLPKVPGKLKTASASATAAGRAGAAANYAKAAVAAEVGLVGLGAVSTAASAKGLGEKVAMMRSQGKDWTGILSDPFVIADIVGVLGGASGMAGSVNTATRVEIVSKSTQTLFNNFGIAANASQSALFAQGWVQLELDPTLTEAEKQAKRLEVVQNLAISVGGLAQTHDEAKEQKGVVAGSAKLPQNANGLVDHLGRPISSSGDVIANPNPIIYGLDGTVVSPAKPQNPSEQVDPGGPSSKPSEIVDHLGRPIDRSADVISNPNPILFGSDGAVVSSPKPLIPKGQVDATSTSSKPSGLVDHLGRPIDSSGDGVATLQPITSESDVHAPADHATSVGPKKPSDYEGGRLPPREELILNTLRRHGSWKTAISELSQSHSVLDQAFVQTLMQYREQMLIRLIGDKARLSKGATNEPESDKDYSFFGEDAGANLLAFERAMQSTYGDNWDKIWRTNAYLDPTKLTNAGRFSHQEGGKEFVQSVNKNTELYNLAHLLQNTKGNAKAEQGVRQLVQSLSPDQRLEVERLAALTPGERQAKKEELLKLSDQKEKAKGLLESGSPEFIRAEREIALLQQELNYYTFEADVGPGSLFNDGSHSSKYQIVLNNVAKIRILAEEFGSLGAAAREYMVFKDMNRIFEALKGTGIILSDQLQLWSDLAAEIGGKEVKADGTEVVGYRGLHVDAPYIKRLTDAQIEDVTQSFEDGIFALLPTLQQQAADGLLPAVDFVMPDSSIVKQVDTGSDISIENKSEA